jgi:hypothetical protein
VPRVDLDLVNRHPVWDISADGRDLTDVRGVRAQVGQRREGRGGQCSADFAGRDGIESAAIRVVPPPVCERLARSRHVQGIGHLPQYGDLVSHRPSVKACCERGKQTEEDEGVHFEWGSFRHDVDPVALLYMPCDFVSPNPDMTNILHESSGSVSYPTPKLRWPQRAIR